MIKRNWFFCVILIGMLFVLARRYAYLPTYVVSNPDSQITFGTEDDALEQTWMPTAKMIAGIQIPYRSENSFICDVQLKIFSNDYSETLVDMTKQEYEFRSGEAGNLEFSFDKTKVIQGERYRIQIALLNADKEGELAVSSGSNYGGCTISGKEVGQAAAFTITFVKYTKLFWLAAVLFPLSVYSLLMMLLTGRKFEEVIAFSVFFEGIFLFLFAVFDQLLLGISAIYVLAGILFAVSVYLFNRKKLYLKDLVSPGLIIYLLFFMIIILFCNGEWLGKRDDLRHWGATVRDMFFYDSLTKHANTTALLPRYLPFTALIEYAFVYVNGLYAEDIVLIAYQTMLLSVLIILFKPLQKVKKIKWFIPVVIMMICVPVMFFNEVSSSIMVDPLQAVILAYVLICYYSEEMSRFNAVRILCALTALTLIKDIGLVLAGIAALIMFGDTVMMQIRKRKMNWKNICYPVMCVCIILGFFLGWQYYLTIPVKENVSRTHSAVIETETNEEEAAVNQAAVSNTISESGISLSGIKNLLTGEGEAYQYQVARSFWVELFDGDSFTFTTIKISFVDLLCILAFLIATLGYVGYWSIKKQRMYVFAGLMGVGGICLSLFLLISYQFAFSLYEALKLESLDRYLAPYICAIVIVILYFIYDRAKEIDFGGKKTRYGILVMLFAIIVSTPMAGIIVESTDREENATEDMVYGHGEIAEILRSVARRGEKVHFICSESDGYSEYIFRNAVAPLISEHAFWDIVGSKAIFNEQYELYKEMYNEEYAGKVLSEKDFENKLKNCQYLVVFHTDAAFKKSYVNLFPETPQDGSVYEVKNENENISLQLIGTAGIKKWR